MAEIRVSTKKVIALILDEKEARWLKGVMQNSMDDDEIGESREYRKAIFTALNSKDLS